MDFKQTEGIKLVINNESDLYNPLNPDTEFSRMVKLYIQAKYAGVRFDDNIKLTIISPEPLDEDRFRAATANWIREERRRFRQEDRITNRMLVGFLVIASIFIILSLFLQKHISVLTYTILPVLGSVSLGRAAGICLTEIPMHNARNKLLDMLEKESIVEFVVKGPEQEGA